MFIFKNSMKNIMRNKGRNILLAVIILVIIVSTVVSLAINNTAAAIINDYKERFSSEVVISLDIESLMGDRSTWQPGAQIEMPEIEPITPQQYLDFGDSEYLSKSIYTATAATEAVGFTPIDNDKAGSISGGGGFPSGEGMQMAIGNAKLYGDVWDGFDSNMRGLYTDNSRYVENDNECLISADLAEANSLGIGSVIGLTCDLTDADGETATINYSLTVVGIYYDLTDAYSNSRIQHPYMNRRNEILTNFATVVAPISRGTAANGITINATYYLKDPDMLSSFESELRTKGLPGMYIVTTDSATYDQIVKPVLSLKNISLIFLIVILVLGGVILTVLAMIAIRERKYEIGTLRAVGMKKSKIFAGLLTEIMAITCACLILGLLVGYFVSQPISDLLLNQQIEAAQEQTTSGPGGFAGSGNRPNFTQGGIQSQARPGTEALSEMSISFDILTILEIAGIAILLAAVPTVISAARITKYEPMRILAERN